MRCKWMELVLLTATASKAMIISRNDLSSGGHWPNQPFWFNNTGGNSAQQNQQPQQNQQNQTNTPFGFSAYQHSPVMNVQNPPMAWLNAYAFGPFRFMQAPPMFYGGFAPNIPARPSDGTVPPPSTGKDISMGLYLALTYQGTAEEKLLQVPPTLAAPDLNQ
ncbi:uncharacterized protein EV420DRAFT_1474857 [Desarmillaria tabescens]|uniref:Uncharacterized protein n=1 Tax=Armillaria tabescens TaxID=1929756 RepID=A0AA39TXH8_ARMTA|nr:uncharacterized protein EV420DRAFT_1474857 [Desarmillaria tabescens]KAK0466049.1 hypothetical protein EV420DRAFT_1474857 [Desarmillaria tabescens]